MKRMIEGHESRARRDVRALSLIELIGVLAVLAIIAAMAVPVVIRRIDIAALNAERSTLSAMKDALVQHIVRSNNIPNQNTWHTAISSELGLSPAQITTTRRNISRAFLIDNSGWFNTVGLASGSGYNQLPGGTVVPPSKARLMIVSTIAKQLPVDVLNGAASFEDIWNAAPGKKPSTWTWDGKGEDLVIQRIDLEKLFHRVLLVSAAGGQGYFSINTDGPGLVPAGGAGTNTYYLDGTVLNLYNTNAILQVREIIRSDMSRVCEFNVWRDMISLGFTNPPPADLGLGPLAAAFYRKEGLTNKWGGTPQGMLGQLVAYMDGYITYADAKPVCFSYNGTGNPQAADLAPWDEINNAILNFSKSGILVK